MHVLQQGYRNASNRSTRWKDQGTNLFVQYVGRGGDQKDSLAIAVMLQFYIKTSEV